MCCVCGRAGAADNMKSLKAEVLYVDYGNRAQVSVEEMRPLHEQFTSTPCLAVPCALEKVSEAPHYYTPAVIIDMHVHVRTCTCSTCHFFNRFQILTLSVKSTTVIWEMLLTRF